MYQGFGLTVCAALVCCAVVPAGAQSSRITEERPSFTFSLSGQTMRVERAGAPCPSRCVQSMTAATGVVTIGELEVIDFIDLFVTKAQGVLVDARLPVAYAAGTLPGAVNLPASTLYASNPYRGDLLNALGVRDGGYGQAFDIVIFGGGPDDPAAQDALRALVASGYPAAKLKYYRGGLDVWTSLGLTVANGP
jgi:rhodanese-related sulfurtransferase